MSSFFQHTVYNSVAVMTNIYQVIRKAEKGRAGAAPETERSPGLPLPLQNEAKIYLPLQFDILKKMKIV
ncbi:MAG: hypothetical protein A2X59_06670 [Nitrospirae bacterium GWC2_42_7]|nr:MAG: hypothetical protein A2X59_06670 [Nitrospirae bacterium GWC2_42_7]